MAKMMKGFITMAMVLSSGRKSIHDDLMQNV